MKMFISRLALVSQQLTTAAIMVSAAGLIIMTLILGWQVFARYILNSSPAWSETAALLLLLYYVMLAAAVGVYDGFHLGLRIVLDSVSKPVKRALEIINNALIAIFGVTMVIGGWRLAEFTAGHIIPTINISRAFAYVPFAAAGALIALFALEKLLLLIVKPED